MRFEVRPVEMYDVIDLERPEDDQIMLNTRDRDEAERVAAEHEEHFAPTTREA